MWKNGAEKGPEKTKADARLAAGALAAGAGKARERRGADNRRAGAALPAAPRSLGRTTAAVSPAESGQMAPAPLSGSLSGHLSISDPEQRAPSSCASAAGKPSPRLAGLAARPTTCTLLSAPRPRVRRPGAGSARVRAARLRPRWREERARRPRAQLSGLPGPQGSWRSAEKSRDCSF